MTKNNVQQYTFEAQLRIRSSSKSTKPSDKKPSDKKPSARYFVSLPKDIANQLKALQQHLPKRGWGSIRVGVQIGFVKRKTSIFPDKKSGTYMLPIKKEVRQELHIDAGDQLVVILHVL